MFEWLKRRAGRAILALIVMLLMAGLAFSFPADIAFLMALDLGTWIEAAVAVYVATQVTKIRPIAMFVRAKLFGRRSGRRSRTAAPSRKQPSSSDDNAPLALAA